MDRRRALLAVVVLSLAALAGCDGPPPQTEVVCDGCVSGVEETVPNVTVADSVTHITLRESGDARVEARLRLSGSGVDDLRVDETRRRAVERYVANRDARAEDDPYDVRTRPAFPREDVAVEMDGEMLLVTFRYPNFSAQRVGGTTLADGFYRMDAEGRENELDYDEPTAFETDRLVVRGPDGTRALVTPPESTDDGDGLVWSDGTVPPRTYLVFGGSAPFGWAAVALEMLSWAGAPAAFAATVPAFLLLGQAVVLVGYYRKQLGGTPDWDPASDWLFWVLVGGELAVAAFAVGWFLAFPLVGFAASMAVTAAVAVGYAKVSGTDDEGQSPGDEPPGVAGPGSPATDEGSEAVGATTDEGPDARPDGDGSVESDDGAAETDAPGAGADGGPTERGDGASDAGHATAASGDGGGLRRFRGHLLAVLATVAATAVVTALVAVDYTAAYAGTVALAAGAVPLVAFPALGYLVTTRGHGPQTVGAVGATVVAPWIASLGQIVRSGGEDASLLAFVAIAWALGAGAVGLLGFYAALWIRSQ